MFIIEHILALPLYGNGKSTNMVIVLWQTIRMCCDDKKKTPQMTSYMAKKRNGNINAEKQSAA
jgi:hypothetical protein